MNMETEGRTFFTSDPHFGHARIIELCDRPFSDTEEMREELIRRWNETVGAEDTVYCLGDLAMGSFLESVADTARLMGRKLLVPGNHDRVFSRYKGSEAKRREWREAYEAAGWEILDEQVEMEIGGAPVILCHFPYEGDSHGADRYADMRPEDHGNVIVHGHVHGEWRVRGAQINVGVDVWDFTPVPEEKIVSLIADILS